MRSSYHAAVAMMALAFACSDVDGPSTVDGEYMLSQLNGATLPYDHEGLGCCMYLDGRLELGDSHYTAWITAQNRNTSLVFTASEQGTFEQDGNTITFTRVSFHEQPLLLSSGTIRQGVITLWLGGEGPGAPDQFEAVFVRE